ncbi:MAG: hypothetical protein WC570_00470 [Patescibacteria group bacterium]
MIVWKKNLDDLKDVPSENGDKKTIIKEHQAESSEEDPAQVVVKDFINCYQPGYFDPELCILFNEEQVKQIANDKDKRQKAIDIFKQNVLVNDENKEQRQKRFYDNMSMVVIFGLKKTDVYSPTEGNNENNPNDFFVDSICAHLLEKKTDDYFDNQFFCRNDFLFPYFEEAKTSLLKKREILQSQMLKPAEDSINHYALVEKLIPLQKKLIIIEKRLKQFPEKYRTNVLTEGYILENEEVEIDNQEYDEAPANNNSNNDTSNIDSPINAASSSWEDKIVDNRKPALTVNKEWLDTIKPERMEMINRFLSNRRKYNREIDELFLKINGETIKS